jgi:ribosomal protein S18 acetylase RimI-like enzyme
MADTNVTVRPVREDDLAALAAMDLRYPAGRVLSLERGGSDAEPEFALGWRERPAPDAVYAEYNVDGLRRGMSRADVFLIAEVEGRPAGLMMVVVPPWTDAAEITDLAVDAARRRSGAGRALVAGAEAWARERRMRALWVEPRSDNGGAIEFYLRLGFRIAGFNDRMYSNRDHEDGRLTVWMYRELA